MRRTGLVVGLLTVCWPAASLLAADRLTDREVKALVSRIEQGRDRFDDALDDKVKRTILQGPSGEVNVDHFLNDFQENIDRLEERLKPEYAASAEVAAVLRQGSAIEGWFKGQPPGMRGESEWNRLATDLKALAAAYGTEFPVPENAAVRRIGDGELATTVEEIANGAGRLKKLLDNDLKKNTAVGQQQRQAIVAEADQLSKDAKTLRERVKDGEPSSAEADRLLTRATKLQTFISGHQLPSSAGAWPSLANRLQNVASAYGSSWGGSR